MFEASIWVSGVYVIETLKRTKMEIKETIASISNRKG